MITPHSRTRLGPPLPLGPCAPAGARGREGGAVPAPGPAVTKTKRTPRAPCRGPADLRENAWVPPPAREPARGRGSDCRAPQRNLRDWGPWRRRGRVAQASCPAASTPGSAGRVARLSPRHTRPPLPRIPLLPINSTSPTPAQLPGLGPSPDLPPPPPAPLVSHPRRRRRRLNLSS